MVARAIEVFFIGNLRIKVKDGAINRLIELLVVIVLPGEENKMHGGCK